MRLHHSVTNKQMEIDTIYTTIMNTQMEKGAAARKALQQGGRFLSDLFKGPQQHQQHQHGGGGEAEEEDALGSSQQTQTHTRALERFLSHVNLTMAASINAKRPPGHQPTLSSSSLSMSASIASSTSSGGAPDEEEEEAAAAAEGEDEEAAHQPFLLNPTFRAVPMPILQQHADASLAVVERIAAYVDERWRLETKYARERGRLKLQLFQGGGGPQQHEHHADVLDGLAEAVALFQEVEATQVGATVEEIDQQVRQPLLQLRETLRAIVQDGRQEQRAIAKEVDGLETRLAKSKAGLARLHERRLELQSRIEQYQRLLASRRGGSVGWEGAHAYPPDTPDPARISGFVDDGPPQQAAPAEAQIIASLERRLFEVEGEMRASEHEIEAQGRLLLDALGRQDRTAARWAHELERADKTRRFTLQAAATAYIEAEARATQRSLFQLEGLMQLAARVDLEADQQGFIARHRDGAGTAPRTPALRLLEQQQEWEQARQRQRRQARQQNGGDEEDGDEDDSGQWEEVDAPQSPAQHRYGQQQPRGSPPPPPPPVQQQEEEMVTLRAKSQGQAASASAATTSASSSVASSPDRARAAREEAVVPSFDKKEDGAVVAAFVQQLFASPTSQPQPPPMQPPSTEGGQEQEEGGLPQATAALASFSFHSTEGERRRFFDRIFAGEDGRGRAAFLAELNLQRSKETNVGTGFEELAQLLWEFLLHAQRNRDVRGAKMGMMLASTFFRPKPQSPDGQPERREFLSRRLQKHPLWKDSAFWTRALQEQVREQLSAMGELLPVGATAWHDAEQQQRAELVARIHNTVFSNTAALAHSMLEFGAPVEDAHEFVLRASEQYGLPEESEHMLLQHLAKREQRHNHHQQRREQTPPAPAAAPQQQEGEEGEEEKQKQGDDTGAQILGMAQAAATM